MQLKRIGPEEQRPQASAPPWHLYILFASFLLFLRVLGPRYFSVATLLTTYVMNPVTFTTVSFKLLSTLSYGVKTIVSVLARPSLDLLLEIPLAIDNQCFGIRRLVAHFLLTYNLVPCKLCFYMHGWPKSFMVLNCVMLEPDVVGNFGLLHKSDRWRSYFQQICQEPTTI